MSNLKTLIIVESPAKATKIQGYLGNDYIVLACYGHITELAKGNKHGIGVEIENDFKPHFVLSNNSVVVLDKLISAAKQCDLILLGCDDDKEGHLISQQLYERLADCNKPMKRILFNEIKKTAILKAINSQKDIDMRIVNSAIGRRILDRLVGFMASPFLQQTYGDNHLSSGRVQSPLTRLVIDRERQIEQFIPEDFYTIQVKLSTTNKESFITKYPNKLSDQPTADATKKSLQQPEYIVSEVLAAPESKYPPPPLITSTLQRIMSRQHSISAEQTMAAAQKLYESGYISYMRTDSVRASDEAITEARQWLKDNKHPTPPKSYSYKNKDAAQDAHECIRPSDISLLPWDNFAIIDPDEKKVYEAIWRNFMASQMPPAIYNTLKITAHVKNDKKAEVKASGKALSIPGYLAILGNLPTDDKIEIPNLKVGEMLSMEDNKHVRMEKKQTQPPPRFSEDKLLKELEMKGIGRPSTYATLLSTVCNRNYVEKRGNVYHATKLGKTITDELNKFFTFMNYDYTAKLELQLDQIEQGKLSHIDMLKKFYPAFKKELDAAYTSHGSPMCEKCGSPMAKRKSKNGDFFLGCSQFPRCSSSQPFVSQKSTPAAI